MSSVRLTAAEARRLGVVPSDTGPARRTTRKEASGLYATTCQTCGAKFDTIAGENRHVSLTHCRFEILQGQRLYWCETCGRYTYSLDRHRCGARLA